jgi:hypothetical protein
MEQRQRKNINVCRSVLPKTDFDGRFSRKLWKWWKPRKLHRLRRIAVIALILKNFPSVGLH